MIVVNKRLLHICDGNNVSIGDDNNVSIDYNQYVVGTTSLRDQSRDQSMTVSVV